MAGSAGSPPQLTVWSCPDCKRQLSDNGISHECNGELSYKFEQLEVVPREQSDALAEAIEALLAPLYRDDPLETIQQREQQARVALNSYREATGGEDEDEASG